MPRGGGRGRGGGRNKGEPEHWEDHDDEETAKARDDNTGTKYPPPQFPEIKLRVPRPLDARELAGVKSYLRFRDLARKGPYFSVLESSSLTDERGRVHKRAGFDPFNDQEKYTAKYQRKKRTVPDLNTRDYVLRTFPQELWPSLDPKRKNPLWNTVENAAELGNPKKLPKRKHQELLVGDDDEEEEGREKAGSDNDEGNDTDTSDPLLSGARRSRNATKASKQRRDDPTSKKAGEKSGLDAEDDFPDDEGRENDDMDEDGEDEPVDSEFEESDDGGGDDYNAEQYFDTGENDDDDYGGGDDEGGTY